MYAIRGKVVAYAVGVVRHCLSPPHCTADGSTLVSGAQPETTGTAARNCGAGGFYVLP